MNIKYEAVIFDMDGVIFDSERAFRECWMEYGEKYGIRDIDKIYLKCTGVTLGKVKEIFFEEYGENFPFEEYMKDAYDLYHERFGGGKLPMKEGVFEILDFLKKNNVKIALASSTAREMVISQLRDAKILPYFDKVISGDMVTRSKPAPDIFLKACEELGVKPENAFAVEDSFNGVRAAYGGGLRTIMVPDLNAPDSEMYEKAEAVVENFGGVIDYIVKSE